MTNQLVENIARFLFLLFIQVIIFNKILLFGFVNPYLYIIFILLFPINAQQWTLMLFSFLLGIILDMFGNSGGAHAAACLIIAYFRPFILQACFGLNYIHQNLKLNNASFKQLTLYVTIMVVIHHLTLFSLEVFQLKHIRFILLQTLSSGLFSIVLIILGLSLFQKNK